METTWIMEKVAFLRANLALQKDKIDAGPHPMDPNFRTGIANYIVAELVRDISLKLTDRDLAAKLHGAAKELVMNAAHHIGADWDEGSEICPPWRFPWPRHLAQGTPPDPIRIIVPPSWWETHPVPWPEPHMTPAMTDIVLAHGLRELATLTTNEKASTLFKQVGETVIKAASSRLYQEYCATPVKPRVPVPKSKVVAA